VTAPTVQPKVAGFGSLLPALSTATTANLCGPAAKLLKAAELLQLENGLLSRLHWKPAMGLVPCVAVNVNRREVENVVPPFVNMAPLPSTAEIVMVCGGCRRVVEITQYLRQNWLPICYH